MAMSDKARASFIQALRTMDDESVTEMSRILRSEQEHRVSLLAVSFRKGDKVAFDTKKYGKIYGVVERIGSKNISVLETESEFGGKPKWPKTWRVYAEYLRRRD